MFSNLILYLFENFNALRKARSYRPIKFAFNPIKFEIHRSYSFLDFKVINLLSKIDMRQVFFA